MPQQLKVMSLQELEPLGKKLEFHSGEAFTRLFLPLVVFDADEVKYHVKEMKRLLDKVV